MIMLRITLPIVALPALLLAAVLGYIWLVQDASAGTDPGYLNELAVDTQSDGANTATNYGAVQPCRSVSNGATLDVDVVIDIDAPPPGVAGVEFDLLYNPAVVNVIDVDNDFWFYQNDPTAFDLTETPDSDGSFKVALAMIDQDGSDYVNGRGVISRITLEAVGIGTSQLVIGGNLEILNGESEDLVEPGTEMTGATVAVGEECGVATPTPSPTTSPSPAPTPAPTPPGSQTPGPSPQVVARGDADCDGMIGLEDALELLQHLSLIGAAGQACQTETGHEPGDINCDEITDTDDLIALLSALAGLGFVSCDV